MNVDDVDLNLLRLFDAIYTRQKISLAADALGISQPAASQGLARLRIMLGDPLFVRAPGGVRPTPRAERLAVSVRNALEILDQGLADADGFDPAHSQRVFRIQMMSDMGEERYLPRMMQEIEQHAPGVRVETVDLLQTDLSLAFDKAQVDFAFGSLPRLQGCHLQPLFDDRYVVFFRKDHPVLSHQNGSSPPVSVLQSLEFVAVHTHADTSRILKLLGLEGRLRLVTQNFLSLPFIVSATNLCVLIPGSTARVFNRDGGFGTITPDLPLG
ncbi:MAG: LysR family transcriptional regulator, partial [Pusillimonas sp.]